MNITLHGLCNVDDKNDELQVAHDLGFACDTCEMKEGKLDVANCAWNADPNYDSDTNQQSLAILRKWALNNGQGFSDS